MSGAGGAAGGGGGAGVGVNAAEPASSAKTVSHPPAPAPAPSPGNAHLWRALEDVMDPEFPISVVDLGLIYDIRRDAARVEVDLTFTATGCPCMAFITDDVRGRLLAEADVDHVQINVVWDPPWTRERMSERGRETLRRFGVAA